MGARRITPHPFDGATCRSARSLPNVPSPLNPVFGGRQMSERSTETEREAAC